jgi:hypothetical protein
MRPRTSRRALQRTQNAHISTLDARGREAVNHFVSILARCGCTAEDIGREVLKACSKLPSSWARHARVAPSALDAAAHVLTLWFSDPAYVDARGRPQPLPLEGSAPSLQALSLRMDARHDAQEILQHLLRQNVLQRVGTRYQPRGRVLIFRGAGTPHHARNLQALVAMLSTLHHNSRRRGSSPGWFEEFAVNAHVPVRAVKAFDSQFRSRATRFLVQSDDVLHLLERRRKKGERTVRLGVGIYRFQETPLPARRGVPGKKGANK